MKKITHLDKSVFKFLKALEDNNNRDWFAKNKPEYLAAKEHFNALAEEVNLGMLNQDNIENIHDISCPN